MNVFIYLIFDNITRQYKIQCIQIKTGLKSQCIESNDCLFGSTMTAYIAASLHYQETVLSISHLHGGQIHLEDKLQDHRV